MLECFHNLLQNHFNSETFRPSSTTTGQSFLEEEEFHVELKAYAKTRQKMHEMAVKQKLITEQVIVTMIICVSTCKEKSYFYLTNKINAKY